MSGQKYATDKVHEESGLLINSFMERDNLQECYEELVDAMFNILVYLYRFPDKSKYSGRLFNKIRFAIDSLEEERARD